MGSRGRGYKGTEIEQDQYDYLVRVMELHGEVEGWV